MSVAMAVRLEGQIEVAEMRMLRLSLGVTRLGESTAREN